MEDDYRRIIAKLREEWPSGDYLKGWGAGLGQDVDRATLEFWLRYSQTAASPSAIVALEEMNSILDIRAILPLIHAPTLVMNRTNDPVANVEAARDLASQIPRAKFVEFPGATHSMTGIEEQVFAEIQRFIASLRCETPTDRFLTTVLCVDVLGTEAKSLDLVGRFHSVSQQQLGIFRGEIVRTTENGFLSIHDGPGRAIRCALSIRNSVGMIGLQVRAGIHSGECERVREGVRGMAVGIGEQLCTMAAPGEVVVSSTVKDLVAGSGIHFDDKGVQRLVAVQADWHVYSVKEG